MSTTTHYAGAGYAPAFVAAMLDDALDHGSRVHGLVGLQGTGKSTLAAQMAALAASRGIATVVLSIDDAYLDQPRRQALAREVHPLLATRGPPGTHDVDLAVQVVDGLRAGRSTALPRFDKISDRRLPRREWPVVADTRLVLLEGWFLKVPAQPAHALDKALNTLERDADPDGTWRRHCNTALAHDYVDLWAAIDRLVFLRGPGFDVVPAWRWQQEQSLQAANPGRQAMTRPQVERFVQFFERVSRQGLATLPAIADRSVAIDVRRQPQTSDGRARSRGLS